MNQPALPSVLQSSPAIQDGSTTPEQLASSVGRVTNPTETPLYICAYSKCFRLFPSRVKLEGHRKSAHSLNSTSENGNEEQVESEKRGQVITWNES